ncbi:MAG TPA: hypothetical protein VFH37_01010 [Candidatus Saccharimonadales bacterium]|nr:hypothetical protein [Candidatus Saccharimonadales bacterium]
METVDADAIDAPQTDAFDEDVDTARLYTYKHQNGEAKSGTVLDIQKTCSALGELSLRQISLLAEARELGQQNSDEQEEKNEEETKETDSEALEQEEPGQATPEPETKTPALKPSSPENKDVKEAPQPQVIGDKAQPNEHTIDNDGPAQPKETLAENGYRDTETAQAGGTEVARPAIIEPQVSPENSVPEAEQAGLVEGAVHEAHHRLTAEIIEPGEDEQLPTFIESAPESIGENIIESAEDAQNAMWPGDSEEVIVALRDDFESDKNKNYELEDDEIYLTASAETPLITLREYSADSAQVEVVAPELSLPIEEVEEAIFIVAERIEEAASEEGREVQQLLEQILTEVENAHSAIGKVEIPEEAHEIEETKEELKVLFIKLFDRLTVDYTPELIDSFVVLALKGDISKLMTDNEDEEKLAAQGMGTHEIINQLITGLRSLKKLAVRAYLVGRSALQLYGYGQQPSAS